jgi:hypothetical protein
MINFFKNLSYFLSLPLPIRNKPSPILLFFFNIQKILLLEKSLMMGLIGIMHCVTLIPFPTLNVRTNRHYFAFVKVGLGTPVKPFLYYMAVQLFPLGDMNRIYIRMNSFSCLFFLPPLLPPPLR